MRMINKCLFLTLFLANAITFNACSNAPAENSQVNSESEVQQKTEGTQQQTSKTTESPIQSELNKAKKAGKAVFVVVTGANVFTTDKATDMANNANTIYKNAVVLQMNRDDAENSKLVTEWRLSGAPLPLILVLSSKGIPTGGYLLSDASAERIAALVPSPKMEAVYEAIGNNKYAIVVFSKKSFPDRTEVIKISKEAVSKLSNEAVIVEVDMDDPKENNFMNQLRIDKTTTASVTLVINKQGQVAGTSTTVPDADKLVAAAKTPVKGGCGPSCGPAGCGK